MAIEVLFDSQTYVGGYDFTGQSNKGSLEVEVNELDGTTFGNRWQVRRGGLKSWQSQTEGFWDSATADAVDPQVFPSLGAAGQVVTQAPTGEEAGPAFLGLGTKFTYSIFDEVGELAPFSLSMSGSDRTGMVRGQLAVLRAAVSATGAIGSPVQLGALASDESLYATVHLFGTAGTSIELDIESDAADTFGSATTRASIGPLSVVGGTWMTPVTGAITDDWFRINVTAITGSWSLAVAVGKV